MPMNSEKAQLSWLRTLLRKLGAKSRSLRSRSAMCLCSRVEGHGSASTHSFSSLHPERPRAWGKSRQELAPGLVKYQPVSCCKTANGDGRALGGWAQGLC